MASMLALASPPSFAQTLTPVDPATRLQHFLEQCDLSPDKACETKVWKFADVSLDGKLGKAEISRLIRLAAIVKARTSTQSAEEQSTAEIMSFVVSPFVAGVMVDNYDFDGDGTLSEAEVFFETDATGYQAFVARILQSGKDALVLGSAMALNSGGRGKSDSGLTLHKSTTPKTAAQTPVQTSKADPSDPLGPLTQAELEGLRIKITSCLPGPMMSNDGEPYFFRLNMNLRPDGTVRSTGVSPGSHRHDLAEPRYKKAAKTLMSTVRSCGPYNMFGKDRYHHWNTIKLTMSVRTIFGE